MHLQNLCFVDCHVDTDVCIYSTCAFFVCLLTVIWMLLLIMYSAVSS